MTADTKLSFEQEAIEAAHGVPSQEQKMRDEVDGMTDRQRDPIGEETQQEEESKATEAEAQLKKYQNDIATFVDSLQAEILKISNSPTDEQVSLFSEQQALQVITSVKSQFLGDIQRARSVQEIANTMRRFQEGYLNDRLQKFKQAQARAYPSVAFQARAFDQFINDTFDVLYRNISDELKKS